MTSMRTKGKSTIVWILMGLLLLGLGGFGVTNFSGGGSTAIGSVGETEITARDYARRLDQDLRGYERQTGQRLNMDTAQLMGLPQQAQAELFAIAAMQEEARDLGLSVGDDRVAQEIVAAPAFQGPNGQFDRNLYADTLRRQGMDEAEFEADMRVDAASRLMQRAVMQGSEAPHALVDRATAWVLEGRDISWAELTPDSLQAPIPAPDDATLQAWHQGNAERFSEPERRKISYVWLTPEMLADTVELDDTALRAIYDERIDQYQQPERRMVERLVYESDAAAAEAKARLDAGAASFEALAAERGLSLSDIDLGEARAEDLGAAAEAVFALDQPGVVGPLPSDLGPALYAMNAILEPVDISFEQALAELRPEAAAARAQRVIADMAPEFEDLLAGGASLAEVAQDTALELGEIAWSPADEAAQGSIAGYPSFRDAAAAVTEEDFPELAELEDGGVFALRLDGITPEALTPFAEIRDAVEQDWRRAETHRLLLAAAEQAKLAVMAETIPTTEDAVAPAPAPALNWQSEAGLLRDGYLESAPPDLLTRAFGMEVGDIAVVDSSNRVALLRVDAITPADLSGETAQQVKEGQAARLNSSLSADLFDYFNRAVQTQHGVRLNAAAIAAAQSQLR